ncbi:hypothetical protein FGIG_05061 [Fasciola gigantica]|uniref:Uncharacterized protein n=1 Tax=Fasciola gigantica TaxID=46835 RepID=A0A504YUR2_FASGI|nr:hypothetical protein FGIG_05061 [Fasciola gigantica]
MQTGSCLLHGQLDTQDAVGLRWSPDGRFLAIWDDCLRYRGGPFYTVDCPFMSIATVRTSPGQDLLGVKSICWSPSGQLLAIGSPARSFLSHLECSQQDRSRPRLYAGSKVHQRPNPNSTPSHFKFSVSVVNWFPRGDALLLLSESHFCLCYLGGADGEKQCLGERDQNPMWEPPKRQFNDLPFHPISSNDPDNREPVPSLPLGVFGPNPKENEETEIPAEYVGPHVGDTPNWLRRRVAPKSDKVSDRCRSCSTDVVSRSHPNRTLTTVSSRRQAWAPAHKSPLGASERQSADELS